MIDKIDFKLRGEFNIDVIKDDEVIDNYHDNNLVVDGARAVLASLISGINSPIGINKLCLGEYGHDEDFDKFSPKKVGGTYSIGATSVTFDEQMASLFAQHYDLETLDCQFSTIANTDVQQVVPLNIAYGTVDEETNTSNATVTCTCNSIVYQFEIEQGVGHGGGDSSILAYTEAGLYAGNVLFALKTFPAKVKDNATKFVITWKIFT